MKKRTLAIVAVLLVAAVMTGIFAACVTEFQLKFMVDGEVYAVVNTAGEETVKLPENPTKEGYIFDGWYWDDGIWAQPFTAESLLEQKLESDMAVYAKWLEEDITKRTFKVTFDSMSGSAVEPVTALYGTLVKKPSDPTRTGYVFVGWYKQADLSEEWDFSSDTLTENITLYAKWVSESDASGCDILTAEGFNFDAEGKTLSIKTPNSQEYFALSSALTVSPYASWTVTSDAEGREEVPSATVPLQVGDNTFYINITSGTQSNKNQYTVNIRRRAIYTVTYDFAGGGESVSEQVEEDGLAPAKEGTRTGYTFSGWTAGETAWDFEESVVTGDITLTAVWTANTYSVTFDAAGGEETEGVEVTFGSAAQLPVPERSGYTFTGWQKEDGTAVSDAAGAVGEWNIAEDVSLTASWSVVTYDVTYNNVEGATHSNPATYTVEDAAVTLQDAAKTGYTFLGWYSDETFEEQVDFISEGSFGDLELFAKWTPTEYSVNYVLDGGINAEANPFVYTVETLGGADGVVALEDPSKDRTVYESTYISDGEAIVTYTIYSFGGWYKDSGFRQRISELSLALGNVTLYAKWNESSETTTEQVYTRSGNYIYFGEYPQTIKASNVSIISTTPDTDGYYLGSDGERYAKVVANPYISSGYTFSDNSSVIYGNTYYFKVEPIRWRILSESDGNVFILCDSIIANHDYHHTRSSTTIDGQTVYPNNYKYSDIRAWLNDEFYNTAFGDLQQALIQTTEVDNSARSTGYSNPYACENTFDKVFLPSSREVTNSAYGFESGTTDDTARQMLTSDFSRATGAAMSTDWSYYGNGLWWLRSPDLYDSYSACIVYDFGRAVSGTVVYFDNGGVVPALNLTLS